MAVFEGWLKNIFPKRFGDGGLVWFYMIEHGCAAPLDEPHCPLCVEHSLAFTW